ncbi:MAG: DNA mismatch repair protein MutS [Bacteroidales bacterium]|nr:DNA mismatch repair protein MutS [Bacteroidales bacterium]
MLKQYFSIKAQYPEAILLYRVGDFYETYSDDALLASRVLGLVLTKRSNGQGREPVAMAGFPHHAIEQYLQKLVRAKYKVAICDQLEDPKLIQSKLVKRGITEILTPGVAFGENLLDQKEYNFLAGVTLDGPDCGVAFLDASTGHFQVAEGSREYIFSLISSMQPKEIVVRREDSRFAKEKWSGTYISTIDDWAFVYESAREKLCSQLGVKNLKGFGVEIFPLAVCSAGALIHYLEQTCHTGLGNICSISRIDEGKFVWMDRFTFRNLEVFHSTSAEDGVALVDVIDRCCSPMGARLLRQWLSMPIMDIEELNRRYDCVQFFVDNEEALDELRGCISEIGDLERIISRVATGRVSPREVSHLGRSLSKIKPLLGICSSTGVEALDSLSGQLTDNEELVTLIQTTLGESPAPQIGKGDVIAPGINKELDDLRSISRGGKDYLIQMQQRECEKTGINSLKIGYNNVFGYYFEVRNTYRDAVPSDWIRKQTLVNAERYITEELKDYEQRILSAEGNIYEIESRLFAELVSSIQKSLARIQQNCRIISKIDVLQSFALQAVERSYCRPVVDRSDSIDIRGGRHPVIETRMPDGEEYVPNDLSMGSNSTQIMILTGPNMAGKSALLRQSALIVLMAQCGSFVPATSARFGYFDKIFTRVGATDNISRGESTFMVEMIETATIMHNLSQRSLVLLDEIGRGTSTYDGMSIARAIVEYIHKYGRGAKTLFATHYHELNDLEKRLARVKNYHIAVKEDGHNVIFLRKLEEGGVAHSFGLHVARMAGMPKEVLDFAERTLHDLEKKELSIKAVSEKGRVEDDGSVQLSFFQLQDPLLGSLKDRLDAADLDNMTPLQAFDLLRKLKEEMGLDPT